MISSGKAKLHELDTVYGLDDVYTMLEIIRVDAYNQRLMMKRAQDKQGHT